MRSEVSVWRLAAVVVVHLVFWMGPSLVLPPAPALLEAHMRATAQEPFFVFLLAFSVLAAASVAYPLRQAAVGGAARVLLLSVAFFGLETVMGQIETAYFQEAFPLIDGGELGRLFARGALTAAAFVPASAWLVPAAEKTTPLAERWRRVPLGAWAWRVPLLAVLYVLLYLTFGYFVAWRFAEVRQFYSGSTVDVGFWDKLHQLVVTEPQFLPFQALRGVLWVAFSVPVILVVRGRREAAVSLGLLLGLFGAQTALPSGFFPPMVRLAHFLETTTSTALFGLAVGLTLRAREAPAPGRA